MATGKALDGKPHTGSSHMRFAGKFSAPSEGVTIMRRCACLAVAFIAVSAQAFNWSDYSEGAEVLVPADATATDSDMAIINTYSKLCFTSGTTITFDISGDVTLSCPVAATGTVVKCGTGSFTIAASAVGSINTFRYVDFEVKAGMLKAPQGDYSSNDFWVRKVTVDEDGTFMTVPGHNTNIEGGLWGAGVVTNTTTGGNSQLRVMNVSSTPCVFSGRILGKGIRWYSGGNVHLTGTRSNFSGTFQLWNGNGDIEKRGTTGFVKIGNPGEESSIGINSSSIDSREMGARMLYLGEGETTSKSYAYYNNHSGSTGMHYWDAGAHGGVTFTGTWNHGSAHPERLVLMGSNTVPCVIAGPWTGDHSTKPTYVIKRGTGTWRFANNSNRTLSGVIAVEDGTLEFESIAETNENCSLGQATCLQSSYTASAFDETKYVDYAYLLGTSNTRGTMEYVGAENVNVSTRPIAVKGEGELRLGEESVGTEFRFSGARALAGGGKLVLSGAEGTKGILSGAADGDGALGIVKEGAGTWRFSSKDGVGGSVDVKAGTLEVAGTYTNEYKWFKFLVRGTVWNHTGANDQNICFAGVRFYGPDGQCLTGTTNMTFVSGSASPSVSDGTLPIPDGSVLEPGQYAWVRRTSGEHYKYYSTRDIDRMFGLDTSESRICVAWYPGITLGNASTWAVITMHMPIDIGPIGAFDVRSNYGPTHGRALADWTLLGSEDGIVWKELARYDYDAGTMPASGRWFSDNTDNKDVARPGKGYNIIVAATNTPLVRAASVSVASNAVLKAFGHVAINSLSVDASGAGNGTVKGFTFAETGTLYVTGLGALAGNLEIPMTFENCTGLDNVSKWNLIVNGEAGRRFHAKARPDGIVITAVGTLLIVK